MREYLAGWLKPGITSLGLVLSLESIVAVGETCSFLRTIRKTLGGDYLCSGKAILLYTTSSSAHIHQLANRRYQLHRIDQPLCGERGPTSRMPNSPCEFYS